MSDIISKWLTETLGIIVEVYSETFIRLIKNGYLIGALLRHYNIINAEHMTCLTAGGDSVDCLDRIAIWLREVNIELDDETKKQLEKGKVSTALDLCHKLYLALHNKDCQHFTTRQLQTKTFQNASLTPVVTADTAANTPHTLSNVLDNYKGIVQWHKDRYQQLLKLCEEQKRIYDQYMTKKMKNPYYTYKPVAKKESTVNDGIPEEDVLSLCENYEELVAQETRAQHLESFSPDPNVVKQMVTKLKKKYDRERVNATFQSKMESMVLAYFWDDLVATHNKKIEGNISAKMLKQSSYEKQITDKMFEKRQQKEIMDENKINELKEIQKKRDFELVERLFAKEEELGDERYRYYYERDRALDLHKQLYEQNQRLKSQRNLEICKNVLEDIVDISLQCAEHKERNAQEMSRSAQGDLAALFPTEEVIVEYKLADDADEELCLDEIERRNAMNISNFEKYCKFEWPWELETHVPDYVERNLLTEIEMAENILGHIVFRLLWAKYPKPSPKPPPNIPKVNIAVCIKSIADLTILPVLKKLLSERQVMVLQIEDAINLCLEAYKDETTVEYPESQFVDEAQDALALAAGKKNKKKGKTDIKKEKKEKKKKEEKGSKKKKAAVDEKADTVVDVLPFQEKQIQTPRIFPCDEPVLTPAAELGRLASEILESGEALNDKLLVQMFIEYLKTLKNIDGWCLINYPTNLEQMCLLEEALTSQPVLLTIPEEKQKDNITSDPNKDIPDLMSYDDSNDSKVLFCPKPFAEKDDKHNKELKNKEEEESVQHLSKLIEVDDVEDVANLENRKVEQNSVIEDTNVRYRVSRLLRNPDRPPVLEDYDCYLTGFIKMVQEIPSQAELQALDEETLEDLDQFYQLKGCLYSIYYKVLDLATIKHLGKLIIGDYSLPPKSSVQIFGETVLYLENDLKQNEAIIEKSPKGKGGGKKKEKPPKGTAGEDKKSKKSKDKEKKEKSSEKRSEKEEKKKRGRKGEGDGDEEPDLIIVKLDKETQMPEPPPEIEEIEIEPEPMPGQLNWRYSDLPLCHFCQVALATVWENLEEIYVCDFRELFFRRRILWKTVMPYLTFIRRYMTDFIQRPDDKQIYLYNFQSIYNNIDEDMRSDDELKAELYCRVHEFREKMWQICDARMREAEEERKQIIMQDWIMKQACELINLNIIGMQLEVDRCCDTLQLLNDYYVAMITKMPCVEDVLEKRFLKYLLLKENFEFENQQVYSNCMRSLLIDTERTSDNSAYHKLMTDNYAESKETVLNYLNTSLKILSGMENYFRPQWNKNKPRKNPKAKGKGRFKLPKFSAPDQEVKDVGLKLIAEWRCAINGEYTRACLRLDVLKSEGDIDFQTMLDASIKTFHGLFNEIKQRYDREINSIKECCDLLNRAIREEVSIQPELVLKDDQFFINPDVRLFEDALPEPEPMLREFQRPEAYTIAQLSFISDVLFDLAPSGIIPERAFVFILQDLVVNRAEDGINPLVPQLWQQLQSRDINKVAYQSFGHVELIDWKDFIIYNLGVEFPNENELMQTRRQFREFDVESKEYVYDYQFTAVRFWFESQFDLKNPSEVVRLDETKKLLFKLYAIDKELVNYTALLLAFCRDRNPAMGLAKALQLSLGKFVCWDIEIGEAFTAILRQRQLEQLQDKMRLEMEAAEKVDTATEIIETVIDLTVHQCDSCYLESYCSADTTENNVTQDEIIDEELLYLEHLMKQYDYPLQNEENMPQYFLQEEFSNIEIGFEPEFYPSKVYYLAFEVLLTVMTAAMPWTAISKNDDEPSFRQTLEDLYENCRNKEFEGIVLMHEFLNSDELKKLLELNTKFVVKKPREIISELLENR